MASNVVRVELGKAQSGVNEFSNKLNELKGKVTALRNRVNETTGWWEGETGNSFRGSFGRACDFFEQTLAVKLNDHAARMLKSVQAQHQQDTDMSGQIKRY